MTKCMACGLPLTPGVDYPRKKEVIHGSEIGPETPILCWEPGPCIERAQENARKEGYSLG